MEIVEISRIVSDTHYGNMSAKAVITADDDPVLRAVELDTILKKALLKIEEKGVRRDEAQTEKRHAISILEDALAHAKNSELPF